MALVTVAGMSFNGFPAAAFEFYEGLEADNSKAFWQANKATFEAAVKAPMVALCEELADIGPFHVFRPYNDLRFAKNRPPYKTHQGAYSESEGGSGHYFHLGADGMLIGVGYYSMAKDQLERFRAAVDDDASGKDVEQLTSALAATGYSIGAMDELKTAPRGYPKDHPRIELLRRKGLMAAKQFPVSSWMHTKRAVGKMRETWAVVGPLCTWLDTHVGPSTLPPEETPF
jgi:uncharacterized protein (TIGR02453 family)